MDKATLHHSLVNMQLNHFIKTRGTVFYISPANRFTHLLPFSLRLLFGKQE
jgi:hypothetical protein